jgi:hypothetical protein
MKKNLSLLFLFIISVPIVGLGKNKSAKKNMFPNYGILQYFVPAQSLHSTNIKLSLFHSEQFLPGKIITCNNEIIVPKGIRYNIDKDEIECQVNNQFSRISSPHKINEVEINGNYFVYKKYLHKGDSLKGYFQKIHSGSNNLYVKYFAKASKMPNTSCNIKKVFFVEKEGSLPKKVNSLKAEIIRIYKGKESLANSFMKTNNYSWHDSKALIQLVNYMEKLSVDKVALR